MADRNQVAQAIMSNYTPSWREQIGNSIYDVARALMPSTANRMREEAMMAVDSIPGVGEAVGLNDAYNDFNAGNYGLAAAGLGATAAGVVPGVGDVVGSGIRGGSNYLRDLIDDVPYLWRDMDAENALGFFNPGGLLTGGGSGQRQLYWASDPSMAIGQNGNTGIKFRMNTGGVMGKHDTTSKPGLAAVASTGGPMEYITRDGVDFSKVDEVLVDPTIMFSDKVEDRAFMHRMRNLVQDGEFTEGTIDDFMPVYRRVVPVD